jgi:ribosomal protein L11 methyltransferase
MKPAKVLWRISVATSLEAEDAVAEMLGGVLNRPATVYFALETGVSTISGFCKTKPAPGILKKISAGLRQIQRCGLRIAPGNISVKALRRKNWAESWKRHFRPIEFGDALLVKPSWSHRKPRRNQVMMVLDPGLSFGTGQHPTTAFCLGEIVAGRVAPPQPGAAARRRSSKSFLDLGTGSGILAIAAAKLGYQPVRALDFDAEAVRIARQNARSNRVGNKLRIARADVATLRLKPARKFDFICANLISDLLLAERRRITAQLNPGGTLVLAGILKKEFPQVRKAYERLDVRLLRRQNRNEWSSGSFRRVTKII